MSAAVGRLPPSAPRTLLLFFRLMLLAAGCYLLVNGFLKLLNIAEFSRVLEIHDRFPGGVTSGVASAVVALEVGVGAVTMWGMLARP